MLVVGMHLKKLQLKKLLLGVMAIEKSKGILDGKIMIRRLNT
jgi:hypothetical protein